MAWSTMARTPSTPALASTSSQSTSFTCLACCSSAVVSSFAYIAPSCDGNASRNACTLAILLIIVAFFSFQMLLPLSYSDRFTLLTVGTRLSLRYTFAQPPSSTSFAWRKQPSNSNTLSPRSTMIPASMPSYCSHASARLNNASLLTIIWAFPSPLADLNLIR